MAKYGDHPDLPQRLEALLMDDVHTVFIKADCPPRVKRGSIGQLKLVEVEGADEDDGSLFGGWGHRDLDEVADPHPIPAPSGGLGKVQPMGLVDHIRAVDMCEVFSPPRVSKEAIKHG